MIDTHAHIYLPEFDDDIDEVINAAMDAGVSRIYMPNIDHRSIEPMLELEQEHIGYCVPMMGLHPCYVKEDFRKELKTVEGWLEKRPFCAIGEIGTDLYWDKSHRNEQVEAFEIQISWAKELDIPIVIHCRESIDMTIDIVATQQDGNLKGVFHCFTGSADQAARITDLNFSLGIGGVATFKNGGLDKVLPEVYLKHLLLETDSPYLAPAPYRGKRNMPAYLTHIADRIAEIMSLEADTVISATTENAFNLFDNG